MKFCHSFFIHLLADEAFGHALGKDWSVNNLLHRFFVSLLQIPAAKIVFILDKLSEISISINSKGKWRWAKSGNNQRILERRPLVSL